MKEGVIVNIVESLVDFFGIDLLSQAETFPEFMQVFLYILCGVIVVCALLKCLFAVPGAINKIN